MTLALTRSITLQGLRGEIVDIEVDVSHGLPSYILLGLPDAALSESRDRIRAAITNSRRIWPNKKVTVSLSPAWLPKSGSGFDLPIAISILAASEQLDLEKQRETLFLGELALDGSLKPIRGVLPMVIAARSHGISRIVVPQSNFQEAQLISDLEVRAFDSLAELLHWIATGEQVAAPALPLADINPITYLDMSDVKGQQEAKFALEVAAVGGHHMMMVGPPGTGKTMLAERFSTIMPQLSDDEAIEVTAIHSVAGHLRDRSALSRIPPFIAPHHSTTPVAMIGGGSHQIKPGAVSLAHHGILFIDEAPECASGILDSLRQPLESGTVSISRSSGTVSYPARFILILAANPCPCGRFFGRGRSCECSSLQVRRYLNKLSGPLLDRMDIRIIVETPRRIDLASETSEESSDQIRARVIKARARSQQRWSEYSVALNAQAPSELLRSRFKAEKSAMSFLHTLIDEEKITARGFHKVLRVAWSIADLKEMERPGVAEVERAISLRSGLRG
jgi:magnesium chelatase family protein